MYFSDLNKKIDTLKHFYYKFIKPTLKYLTKY